MGTRAMSLGRGLNWRHSGEIVNRHRANPQALGGDFTWQLHVAELRAIGGFVALGRRSSVAAQHRLSATSGRTSTAQFTSPMTGLKEHLTSPADQKRGMQSSNVRRSDEETGIRGPVLHVLRPMALL